MSGDDTGGCGFYFALFLVTTVVSGVIIYALLHWLLVPDCSPSMGGMSFCGVSERVGAFLLAVIASVMIGGAVAIGVNVHDSTARQGDGAPDDHQSI